MASGMNTQALMDRWRDNLRNLAGEATRRRSRNPQRPKQGMNPRGIPVLFKSHGKPGTATQRDRTPALAGS